MSAGRTVVLGAGFGGLSVAHELSRRLGGRHEVVLVDREERFVMGLRKLWELVGSGTIAEGSRSRELAGGNGVVFVCGEIDAIEPDRRAARVAGEVIEGDHLVVALGAQPRPDLVDGLAAHGHDVWSIGSVPAARDALAAFDGGRIAIVIAGVPYTCPPAPYECAMLVDEHLRRRGLRERAEIVVTTVQPLLMPNAGKEGSTWIGERLAERGISFRTACRVERVDADRVVFADGELGFDLLVGVPPHRPPPVVVESGLAGDSGWVTVDPRTLETAFPGVFAVGDMTQIMLANGLMLPKAGLMAELQGRAVGAAIAAALGAGAAEPFDGRGHCFIELGSDLAALVQGDFYATPEPLVEVTDASAARAAEKHQFEREHLARWFGG